MKQTIKQYIGLLVIMLVIMLAIACSGNPKNERATELAAIEGESHIDSVHATLDSAHWIRINFADTSVMLSLLTGQRRRCVRKVITIIELLKRSRIHSSL